MALCQAMAYSHRPGDELRKSPCSFSLRRFRPEKQQVDYLENPCHVYNQQRDVLGLLSAPGGVPEGYSLPDDAPGDQDPEEPGIPDDDSCGYGQDLLSATVCTDLRCARAFKTD